MSKKDEYRNIAKWADVPEYVKFEPDDREGKLRYINYVLSCIFEKKIKEPVARAGMWQIHGLIETYIETCYEEEIKEDDEVDNK